MAVRACALRQVHVRSRYRALTHLRQHVVTLIGLGYHVQATGPAHLRLRLRDRRWPQDILQAPLNVLQRLLPDFGRIFINNHFIHSIDEVPHAVTPSRIGGWNCHGWNDSGWNCGGWHWHSHHGSWQRPLNRHRNVYGRIATSWRRNDDPSDDPIFVRRARRGRARHRVPGPPGTTEGRIRLFQMRLDEA